jgi:hypothetical protein
VITVGVKFAAPGAEEIRRNNRRFERQEEVAAVAEGLSGEDRVMMIEGRMLKPEDRIYDLVDLIDSPSGFREQSGSERNVVSEKIFDLVDVVVDRKPKMAVVDTGLHDEIMKRATEIAERIAREIIPDIAERVIREEIEKLKKEA